MTASTDITRASPRHLAKIKGRIVTPDDPTYDRARTVFYGGIDKRP